MWIRSQDRLSLVNTDLVKIHQQDKTYIISTYYELITLGTYSSEEKAMKVLDEITTHIVEKGIVDVYKVGGNYKIWDTNKVYYMPKDVK